MSLKVTIDDANGGTCTVEVSLESIGATINGQHHPNTQRITAAYTADIVNAICKRNETAALQIKQEEDDALARRRMAFQQDYDRIFRRRIIRRKKNRAARKRLALKAPPNPFPIVVIDPTNNVLGKITLHVRDVQGNETKFVIGRETRLSRLLDAYAANVREPPYIFHLQFEGQQVCFASTADLMGIQNGDMLDIYDGQVTGCVSSDQGTGSTEDDDAGAWTDDGYVS